jgi:hypothetical protein
MPSETPHQNKDAQPRRIGWVRISLAVLLCALVGAYSIGILTGGISAGCRIDVVHLGIIILAVSVATLILQPEILRNIKALELKGFKLEMLEKVREKQVEQGNQLDDIRLMLPLLLSDTEQKHLSNLSGGKTRAYRGSHTLRTDLRRLRYIRLIRLKKDKRVADMKDGLDFDLANFVELTPLGDRWATRLAEFAEEPQQTIQDASQYHK